MLPPTCVNPTTFRHLIALLQSLVHPLTRIWGLWDRYRTWREKEEAARDRYIADALTRTSVGAAEHEILARVQASRIIQRAVGIEASSVEIPALERFLRDLPVSLKDLRSAWSLRRLTPDHTLAFELGIVENTVWAAGNVYMLMAAVEGFLLGLLAILPPYRGAAHSMVILEMAAAMFLCSFLTHRLIRPLCAARRISRKRNNLG